MLYKESKKALNNKINNIQSIVDVFKRDYDRLSLNVDSLTQKKKALSGKIDALETEIKNIKDDVKK